MKKILIIQGHPDPKSYCYALGETYKKAAQENAEVKEIRVKDLQFNPNLDYGYNQSIPLEKDLEEAQNLIRWADHLVWIYPTWWGTMPALLKGFIDRVFLPGFAFKYRKGSVWWDKFLKGKSARLIVTMDSPTWFYHIVYGSPGHKAMKRNTLGFSGVKPVKILSIGPIKGSSDSKRGKWLEKVGILGQKMI